MRNKRVEKITVKDEQKEIVKMEKKEFYLRGKGWIYDLWILNIDKCF